MTHTGSGVALLVRALDLWVASLQLAAVGDGLPLRAHPRLEVGVCQHGAVLADLGEAHRARELHVALPVDGASCRGDFDVDDDVAEGFGGEVVLQVLGGEDRMLERSEAEWSVVLEEDGEHVVAAGHSEGCGSKKKVDDKSL